MRPWNRLLASIIVVTGVVTGCQQTPAKEGAATEQGASAAPESASTPGLSPYGRDVERVCYSEQLSGALERDESERRLVVAMWLGKNLETQEGRDFVVKVAQASPAEKVTVLQEEARTAGLPGCPLAQTWSAELDE